jgi:hypothetical protein
MEIMNIVPGHESSRASLQENVVKLLMYMGKNQSNNGISSKQYYKRIE